MTLSAVSGVAAREIARAVPRAGEVLVIPNGIDPQQWQLGPRAAAPGVLRVVTVMRMAPRKRTVPLVRILEAATRGLQRDAEVTATLIGDGPERARAEKFVRDHGMSEHMRFTGRLDRTGILEAFASSDVYLQPSVRESFGLAALEARTAGLPVVARSQTGTTEFVREGVEGFLADTDQGLAKALVRLALEPDLLDRVSLHNSTVLPAEAWPSVLTTVRGAYDVAAERALRH